MLFNIDFNISALILTVIIYIYLQIKKYNSPTDKYFKRIVLSLIIATTFDLVSSYTISNPLKYSELLSIILNSICYFFIIATDYLFFDYIATYIELSKNKKISRLLPRIIVGSLVVILVINLFNHMIFGFDENHVFVHGPFHVALTLVYVFYIVVYSYLVIYYIKCFKPFHLVSLLSFIVFTIAGMAIQFFVFPNVMLICFLLSISLLMILLTLETPDYRALMQTMEELKATEKAANIANETKVKFLTNMSHEIRTPINTILGMNEMILRDSNDSIIKEYAYDISRSGVALMEIVDKIFEVTEIAGGDLNIAECEYNLEILIEDCVREFKHSLDEKGLTLRLSISPDCPSILYGDISKIKYILNELVGNAIKYSNDGIINLNVNSLNTENDVNLIVSVKDTGIGIKKEDIDILFEMFERADLEKTRSIPGIGIGLPLANQVAHSLGGRIDVQSLYGVGSRFTLTVPQKVIDNTPIGNITQGRFSDSVSVEAERKQLLFKTARVLAVDDVELNLRVIEHYTSYMELTLDTALGGEEAFKLACTNKYDLILMDHMMPKPDGIETLHNIKDDPASLNKDTPVVALTANALRGSREAYKKEGFDDYMAKPVRSTTLENVLQKYLTQ